MKLSQMTIFQKLALVYAAMFVFTVALGYIPAFTNEAGELFGLFRIELKDDILHLGSGIWAAVAAWMSTRAAIFYFKTFGIIYGADGLLGLITGHGYLDGGIFLAGREAAQGMLDSLTVSYWPLASFIINAHGSGAHDLPTKIAANLPHILIGGTAIYIGYVLTKKYSPSGS